MMKTVKKKGPTKDKQFFVCARGEGHSSNPEARCDFFMWVDYKKKLPILIVSCVYKDILQNDLNKKIVLIL